MVGEDLDVDGLSAGRDWTLDFGGVVKAGSTGLDPLDAASINEIGVRFFNMGDQVAKADMAEGTDVSRVGLCCSAGGLWLETGLVVLVMGQHRRR